MNADGDWAKQLKTTSKVTWDATTDRDAFESYAIAAATAALTAGLTDMAGLNNAAQTANTANTAANSPSLYVKFGKALAESAISTTASTAVQSAVNGEDFGNALKSQIQNIVVGAIANVAAKEIGMNYKTSEKTAIDKAIQLTSHAALGAATAELTGNNAVSGAVSGVVGELGAEFADKKLGLSENGIKEFTGIAGGLSAIITGEITGQDDHETAQNIYSGQRIGKNAGENNYLQGKIMDDAVEKMWLDGEITDTNYQEYKQAKLEQQKLAGEIILTGATLGQGGTIIQGGKVIGKELLKAKLASATVNGISGASGGAWGAYVAGGDSEQIFNSAKNAGLINAGIGFFCGRSSLVNGVTSGSVSGLISSTGNTYIMNPNATLTEYLNNGLEGAFGGAIVGGTQAVFTPANGGFMGQIIGAQTALPVNLFMGAVNEKYDILPINRANNE